MIFNWPFTNLHELSLDWVIQQIIQQKTELQNFVALNTIKYANPFQWSITSQYAQNTLVIDPQDGTAYLSLRAVPQGVQIENTDYWTPVFTLQNFIDPLKEAICRSIPQQEDGQAATQTIPANSLFFVGDALCTNSAEIPNTSLVIVGSNCTQISVAELIQTLQQSIEAETAAREQADTQLLGQISAEVSAREQADTQLSGQISAEVSAREQADTQLQQAIDENIARQPTWTSVTDYGADKSGATDATNAFSSALAVSDFVYVPAGSYLLNSAPALRDKNVLFFEPNVSLSGNGASLFTDTVDQPSPSGVIFFSTHYAVPTSIASHNIRTIENFSGGAPGSVHSALHIYDVVQNAACALYEWALLARLENHSDAGQNVATYMQARKYGTGPTWGACVECFEETSVTNPQTGLVGIEVDLNVNNTDDNFNRVGVHIIARPNEDIHSTTQNQAGAAIRIGTNPSDALFRKGIEFQGNVGIGIDFEGAEISQNVIQTAEGQQIKIGRINANGTIRSGQTVSVMAQAQIPVNIDGNTYYIPLYTS